MLAEIRRYIFVIQRKTWNVKEEVVFFKWDKGQCKFTEDITKAALLDGKPITLEQYNFLCEMEKIKIKK